MNAKVIVAPEYLALEAGMHSIYLAGAIDMGAAVDWQQQIIDRMQDERCVFINPRRAIPFTPDMLDEQIEWELYAMERADTILMWFPKDSKAPIALFESGIYWNNPKLVVGAEQGFYRRRNLELTADYYDRPLYPDLFDLVLIARSRISITENGVPF